MPAIPPEELAAREAIAVAEKDLAKVTALLASAEARLADYDRTATVRRLKMRLDGDEDGVRTLTREGADLREEVRGLKEDHNNTEAALAAANAVMRRLKNAEQIKRDCRRIKKFGAKVAEL